MSSPQSPLDEYGEFIRQATLQGQTNAEIARSLYLQHQVTTSEASIRRAKKRLKIVSPARPNRGEPTYTQKGDMAVLDSGEMHKEMSPEELIRLHKLDPDEWEIKDVVLNRWNAMTGAEHGNEIVAMYQLKVYLKKKIVFNFVVAPSLRSEYRAPRLGVRKVPTKQPQLWVVGGDEQGTLHHEVLHEKFCSFLHTVRPYGMVCLGDLTDQNAISRHKDNPEWHVPLNDDLQAGVSLLEGYRMANEEMLMYFMPGNHDIRVRNYTIERAAALYGVRPGRLLREAGEQLESLHLRNLLRLDDLNVTYVDPGGEYEHAEFKIGPHVAVRHGNRTGKNAALNSVDRLTYSLIMGHTHAQSVQHKTIWDIDGNHRTITAVETGALCDFAKGLGYTRQPNWVNGFVTVTLWPDGEHDIETAKFDGKHLVWRGQRF